MSVLGRLGDLFFSGRAQPTPHRRETGRPTSSNGASSMHASWRVPPTPIVAVEATLEVTIPPSVPDLHFWALQASFTDRGRKYGAGHLGLQWHRGHPGGTAVNWGGYSAYGSILEGTDSPLPSADGNPHTRDYHWEPHRPYRLRIAHDTEGWAGTVISPEGERTVVRRLLAPGHELEAIVVWSEVFAPCDAPTSQVRWSDLTVFGPDGSSDAVTEVITNYQDWAAGGCTNTDVSGDGGGVLQTTATARLTPPGATVRITHPRGSAG